MSIPILVSLRASANKGYGVSGSSEERVLGVSSSTVVNGEKDDETKNKTSK